MRANSAPQSVADYCHDLNDHKIVVNEDYQRSDQVWKPLARSYFIESILLEYPIPKIYLYSKMDLLTRQSIKEIVDGQQRSRALQAFFNNKMRLSIKLETEDFRGKRYKDLDEDWQGKFLTYSLPIDDFSGVTEDDIQESFRRMNASNVPLNAEEQRNAKFQGEFKWMIIGLAKEYKGILTKIGLFSRRDIVRMQDMRTYAEIACVLDRGFITIKSSNIDSVYRKFDSHFDTESPMMRQLQSGLHLFAETPYFQRQALLRSHIFQSVILALIEISFNANLVGKAKEVIKDDPDVFIPEDIDFEQIISVLEDKDYSGVFDKFSKACRQGTNVNSARAIRFLYFYYAMRE